MKQIILTTLFTISIVVYSNAQAISHAASLDISKSTVKAKKPFSLLDQPGAASSLQRYNYKTHKAMPEEEAKWRRVKGGGIALTAVGSACIVTGLALWEKSFFHRGNREGRFETGLICLIAGAGTLGGGIPMMIKGNKELKKIKRQRGEIVLQPTGTGGKLVYNF